MKISKGIILAGGAGSRLYPLTKASNKQLLPIYDKPVIYYPLTTLMLAGIRDFLIISSKRDLQAMETLLGDGSDFGLSIAYAVQENPNGLPEAFIIGEKFIDNQPVALVLGDNFFHGHDLSQVVYAEAQHVEGAKVFAYGVEDPERYGVVELDKNNRVASIEEKPTSPKSNLAITGLYYFDGTVSERAKSLKPSQRGELEIVDLIKMYHKDNSLSVKKLGRGFVWFDVGTPKSLLEASQYVEVIQSRQGSYIASPEEVAWHMGFIKEDAVKAVELIPNPHYRDYLLKVMK